MDRRYVLSTILVTTILLVLKLTDLDYDNLQNESYGWIISFVLVLTTMCYALFFKFNKVNE
ncbi:hypothetical protein SAMN04515667_2380 [Formosa sp. Hel1_31_208]|uniref:hypothetical protein n=1 Tax=Formosa sp. Hel1_31_208 TaxID=1798225 RepID=UPI00087C37C4|nr:hypothetical protein [Formosa sp. Hel1_31_208]SDS52920.1 hypothetical protein SAMN04515667_2380 [Formosa sp. Hel1_31_208]